MDSNTRNGFDAPKENINVLFTLSFIEIKICSSRVNVLATIGKLPMGVISLICFQVKFYKDIILELHMVQCYHMKLILT